MLKALLNKSALGGSALQERKPQGLIRCIIIAEVSCERNASLRSGICIYFKLLTLVFAVRLVRHWSQPAVFLKVFLPSFLPLFLLSFQKKSLRTWIVCQPPSLTEQDTWVWGAIRFPGAGSRITGLALRKGFSKPMKLALIPFCHERSPWRCFQQSELVSELPRVLSWWTDQWSQTMEPELLYEVGHARLLVGMHVSVKASMYPDRLYINVWLVDFCVAVDGPAIQKRELELCLRMWKRTVISSKSQERRWPPWGHSLMTPQRVCYMLGDVCASDTRRKHLGKTVPWAFAKLPFRNEV